MGNPEVGGANRAPELHEEPPADPRDRLDEAERAYFKGRPDSEVIEFLAWKDRELAAE